ncbi:MAG: tetratricopeptide repeat protein [Symploca sp. SIO2E6]|nr:tetratricopeptide repeat protein [Symploca sp. SIO2E6]
MPTCNFGVIDGTTFCLLPSAFSRSLAVLKKFCRREKYLREAITSYDQAIEIKPDYVNAWNNRGNELGKLGKYTEAIASYEKAIEIKPDHANAWVGRGFALESLKRYDDALESYEKAIQLDSNTKSGLHRLITHIDQIILYQRLEPIVILYL